MCEIAIASSHGGGVCPWEGVGLATVPYLTRGSCGSLTLSQIKTVCLSADIESGGGGFVSQSKLATRDRV